MCIFKIFICCFKNYLVIVYDWKYCITSFFLYVVLVSGYCSSLLNCGLQRYMRDSVYFKHYLILLSIYIFTFILNWYTFDSLAISQQEDFTN